MSSLKNYLAEQLELMHKKQVYDYNKAADEIIEKMLDPNYTPRTVEAPKKNITKVESYEQFQSTYQANVYKTIYSTIINCDDSLSRGDIAAITGLRMSTVCGRIAELIEAGAVQVDGVKIDPDTCRRVETLSITPNIRKTNEQG